ncbi:MAG: GNAT family N-acetyltransferase, partial [Oscillospiraceae bacterium]|nr:GNAT family N-acetyltransferase [Oscillospiraceae bacterium]
KMEEIFIRSLVQEDLMLFYTMGSDTEACRASGAHPAADIVQAQLQLETAMKNGNCFAIVQRKSLKPVGLIYASPDIHRLNRKAYMLSYRLDRNYWGRGYMPRAVKYMLKFLFMNCGADVVSVAHFTENLRSKRVIEKCGFVYEGTIRREFAHWDGRILDSCVYSMLYEEYKELYAGDNTEGR